MHSNLFRSGSSLDLTVDNKELPPEGKLRRVVTAHTRRRTKRKHELLTTPSGIAAITKGPLHVVHSVPLSNLARG